MRQVWEVFADPKDKDRRLFVAGKNARDRGGLAFRIVDSPISLSESGDFVGRVEWQEGLLNVPADDIAFQALDTEDRDPRPIEWLRDALKDGPRPTREVQQAAKQEGISEGQLRRARERLKITPQKNSYSEGWGWTLSAT